jgi:hypothetical protein
MLRQVFLLYALSHPGVALALRWMTAGVHRLPGGATLEERVRELFGPDLMAGAAAGPARAPGCGDAATGQPAPGHARRSQRTVYVCQRPPGQRRRWSATRWGGLPHADSEGTAPGGLSLPRAGARGCGCQRAPDQARGAVPQWHAGARCPADGDSRDAEDRVGRRRARCGPGVHPHGAGLPRP